MAPIFYIFSAMPFLELVSCVRQELVVAVNVSENSSRVAVVREQLPSSKRKSTYSLHDGSSTDLASDGGNEKPAMASDFTDTDL
ncbi:hypothetical protein HDV63DRAFT_415523 [Trichoderma sp. SZMC 28014]